MSQTKTLSWHTEDHLETSDDIAAYLEAAFEDGDPELVSHALGVVSRSRVMRDISERTGAQGLQAALSQDGRPEFVTVLKLVRALGLKLSVAAA